MCEFAKEWEQVAKGEEAKNAAKYIKQLYYATYTTCYIYVHTYYLVYTSVK